MTPRENVFNVEAIEAQIKINKEREDNFAIGFAYWCEWRDDRAFKTYEELLQIYKKEKGL